MGNGDSKSEKSKTYVEEMVANKSSNSVRDFLDVVIVTVIVVLVIAEVVLNVYKGIQKHRIALDEAKIQEKILDSRWLNEQSKIWDAMFANGEYEQMVESFNEAKKEKSIAQDYKHEEFIYQFNRYEKAEASIDAYLAEGTTHTKRATSNLLYDTISFIHGYDFLGSEASAEERDVIEKKKIVIYEKTSRALGMTDEEFDNLMSKTGNKGSSTSFTKCDDIASEMVGNK